MATREITQRELALLAVKYQGDNVEDIPQEWSCSGWYLEVDADGFLTGEIVEADDIAYTIWQDEKFGAVYRD